ncbi:MAG: hypothetical protein J7545_14875 [Roseofilum sp. SBFL]|uniref:hypothetical protein n=1 Tax=unclassified Roseofilum TaxID=2620099 RepID=UPI001B0E3622|nr:MULTISPECIES: hypothetical protein [unclassified Roseofilum]MBP0011531.1 hypothetical protein [Roseofilum sp. SID3]MBP0025710.1 hypothetical protein [Roseofilum sp. SID2]MBP0038469.1 hypothetical protein [Roseofilum sp. SID1]MBP0043232.1 hypothetical protein [Roseofilum sp. SBFL]
MNSDLEDLRISDETLQNISGISIHDSFLGEYYRVWAKVSHQESNDEKRNAALLRFSGLELGLFFLTLVIASGTTLLTIKNSWNSTNPNYWIPIVSSLGLSAFLFLIINLYVYLNSKPLIYLLTLLNELDNYERIVTIFYRIDQLITDGYMDQDSGNRHQMVEALRITKDSFIHALKAERLVREYHQVKLPDDLFDQLDRNLSDLIDFDIQGQESHYGRLINETLEIGISVHRELRKLQQVSESSYSASR